MIVTPFNVVVMVIVILFFGTMARRYWKNEIGAGPTILIIGALILWGFGSYLYVKGQSEQRSNDLQAEQFYQCIGKIDRSAGNRQYNLALIDEISNDVPGPNGAAIVTRLTNSLDAFLPQLKYSSCDNPRNLPLPDGDTP